MIYFDDLIEQVQERGTEVFSNYSEAIIESGFEKLGFASVGESQNSNLTAQQVGAGETGSPIPVIKSMSSRVGSTFIGIGTPLMIIGGLIIAAVFIRK